MTSGSGLSQPRLEPPGAATGYSDGPPHDADTSCRSTPLATPNYSYEKRQRELAKKKKNEEKRLRKLQNKGQDGPGDEAGEASEPDENGDAGSAEPPATETP